MVPITVINLAAGGTDIYHLSSQYPWFRIVPKTYLDFVCSIPRCTIKKRACWEREVWKEHAAGPVPVFRGEWSAGVSTGILSFSSPVLVSDHHFISTDWMGSMADQPEIENVFKNLLIILLFKLIWLILRIYYTKSAEFIIAYSFHNLKIPTLCEFSSFMFHSQLYGYRHF